jgi:CheY-like chemotaxis protein
MKELKEKKERKQTHSEQQRIDEKPDNGGSEMDFREHLGEKLRTPLNAIIGFAELLALQPDLGNGSGDVKQILKAARDLLAVVDRELTSPAPAAHARQPSRASSGCDLLYIEDDIANYILVERILELRPGLKLKHATSGKAGVEIAVADRPGLILLDLNLPDIHGAEVLQLLQKAPETQETPVVVLSANATPSQIERLLAGGARNYLTKPFDIDPFLAVVDEFTVAKS